VTAHGIALISNRRPTVSLVIGPSVKGAPSPLRKDALWLGMGQPVHGFPAIEIPQPEGMLVY